MRMHIPVYRVSVQRILQIIKTAKNWYFQGDVCDKATAQTAQFQATGIVLGTSQHRKDVAFVSEFWWRTYGLDAISQRKEKISVIGAQRLQESMARAATS